MIDQAYLKERFRYDPYTGELVWASGKMTGKAAGCLDSYGYRVVRIGNKGYKAHRLIWCMVHGSLPRNTIDHINGDKSDNRLSNLRDTPMKENNKNKPLQGNNRSGVMGVCWNTRERKWESRLKLDGFNHFLGRTKDFFEAVCARKSAENKLGFHANHGR